MATQSLALLFLVEGNLQPSYISVPHYHSDDPLVTIDDLGKAIFEYHCKDLASSYRNLTIIKVGIQVLLQYSSLSHPLIMSLR